MVSVTGEAMRGFAMHVLTFLALVAVSSPYSPCWFHGVSPKEGAEAQTCKSQGLLNFWCKKTVTGTDISPLQEIPESYGVRQDSMTVGKRCCGVGALEVTSLCPGCTRWQSSSESCLKRSSCTTQRWIRRQSTEQGDGIRERKEKKKDSMSGFWKQ